MRKWLPSGKQASWIVSAMQDSELKKRRNGKHKPLVRHAGVAAKENASASQTKATSEGTHGTPGGGYRQFEIWWAALGGKGLSPCVVLQSDRLNRCSQTTLVVPLQPGRNNRSHTVNIVPGEENGLAETMHLNLTRVLTVLGTRLERKAGEMEADYKRQIRWALDVVIGSDA